MLVKDCMIRHPVMAPPTMLAAEAELLMQENQVEQARAVLSQVPDQQLIDVREVA